MSQRSPPSWAQPRGGERRAAHVEADRDLLAVPGDRRAHPFRRLEGRSAEVDPCRARRQCRRKRAVVADPARQFDCDVQLPHDVGEQGTVVAAAERGVEVDEVHPLGAVTLPAQRGP